MRKLAFFICENKDADQLRSNCAADQRLCFRCKDSVILLLSKPLATFCGSTAQFMSDLVGNPEDWFSHKAQIKKNKIEFVTYETVVRFLSLSLCHPLTSQAGSPLQRERKRS